MLSSKYSAFPTIPSRRIGVNSTAGGAAVVLDETISGSVLHESSSRAIPVRMVRQPMSDSCLKQRGESDSGASGGGDSRACGTGSGFTSAGMGAMVSNG